MTSGFRRLAIGGASLALAGLRLAAGVSEQSTGPAAAAEPHRFLRTVGVFSPSEIARLERGEAVAKVLDTDRREVAIAGAVRVKGPRDRLFARYRNVSNLRGNEMVLQVGAFSPSPRPDDLRDLAFEDYDLETIRDCLPGDCGVRLSAESMARFRREVDWNAADWRQQAGTLWRRLLADYAAGYLSSGALGDYRNKATPLSVAGEFGVLFRESPYLETEAHGLFAYLQRFPGVKLTGAEDILYWSKDNFGLRPVTSITHLTLHAPGDARAARPWWISTKQIYATHYFDAALGLTIAFDDNASGFYMVCVNRARTRSLTSISRTLVRSAVQRRSRDGLEQVLRSTKLALEKKQ
jgi:hypothetical protein